jgi:phosphocarrier protein FPr
VPVVGLVVVSHSRALARAAVALAREMVHGQPVRIETAAGLDETTFGTDATQIVAAVAAADSGSGGVVLMDLGSAVLSAELALDLLDDTARERVRLCPGPLVEGLVVAAVTAATGAGLDDVADEAAAALAGKQSHLGQVAPRTPGSPVDGGWEATATFTVVGPHGLHARPAARLVARVRAFDARIQLRNRSTGSPWVPASSLSRVATLGARHGHDIEMRASGAQASQALDRLLTLAAGGFGETPPPDPVITGPGADPTGPAAVGPVPPASGPPLSAAPGRASPRPATLTGVPASPGIGIGPAWTRRAAPVDPPDGPPLGAAVEWRRLREAITIVRGQVHHLRDRTARAVGDADAAIFDAHLLLLDDPDLLDDVRARIDAGEAAARAWAVAVERVAADFAGLADDYLRARAADVRAVGDQVLRALLGGHAGSGGGGAPDGDGVLIADDLTAFDAAGLDPDRVAGVLLAYGSATSHAVILARARAIPAVVGLGPGIAGVPAGTPVALDGATGQVEIDPSAPVLASLRDRARDLEQRRRRALATASAPALTRDGVPVAVGANVGSVRDATDAAASGADLVGLVRTEFLFVDRVEPPGAAEQEAVYREIAEALGGRRITLRTMDVGGDKPLRYAPSAPEANPFLGARGIRHSLAHPRLLADQLLAIVRLAHDVPVSVMFPMVGTVDEVVRARRVLDDVIGLLGAGRPAGLRVGIMVEVPAAALKAAAFAGLVDFFSIGTNDLTQYAMAAERGNPAVAALADGLDPGVLRLVDAVCRGAGGRVPVAVCGELAADERAAAVLTGLGVRQLSVPAAAVPLVKEAVRAVDLSRVSAAAVAALDAPDAGAVRALLP